MVFEEHQIPTNVVFETVTVGIPNDFVYNDTVEMQTTIIDAPLDENVTYNDVIEDITHPNQNLTKPEALRRSQFYRRCAILDDYNFLS